MTRTCNFPISETRRCRQPIADDRPNCGRHSTNLSADQFGQNPTAYRKGGELHVWAGEPDDVYCLIHSDPAYQVLYQLSGETPPCCLKDIARHMDEHGRLHRDDGPAQIWPDGSQYWYQHGNLHRDDGPAWIWPHGKQQWYQHGMRHREDGPAVIEPNGTQQWFWYGKEVIEEEHAKLLAERKAKGSKQ